jgi:RND family efflux transporter MFP subunit
MSYKHSATHRKSTGPNSMVLRIVAFACVVSSLAVTVVSCGKNESVQARTETLSSRVEVGVTDVIRRPLTRNLTISSEFVPFQEIDVYAKESGFVKRLLVDYGDHVRQGQLLAVLEIPELEATIQQDESAIMSLADQVRNAEHQLDRVQAQHKVLHLQFDRINSVAQSKPGLVAQQEVDDVQGRDLAAEAQVEGAKSTVEVARSNWVAAKAKLDHDQALYAYAKITAPFAGVVTQRYANLGTLLQAGTSSSTQAMPLVKLSKEDLYRLVIPVPEAYVGSIRVGDPVAVRVPALNQTFHGKVSRFSFDVHQDTRTMHTEVDVPNPKGTLLPGLYAEVILTLNKDVDALAVPLESVDREGDKSSVYLVDTSGKVERRAITLGVETATDVEVRAGLQEGEQVIVSDRSGLTPGQEVHARVITPTAYKPKVGQS